MLTESNDKISTLDRIQHLFKNRNKLDEDKTIYIHIGPHKTGTTTIQHALFINETLLRKNGILCPKSGRVFLDSAATHNLGFDLAENKNMFNPENGTWSDLLDEIKHANNCKQVIISSEVLSTLKPEKIKNINEYLKGYKVKIIIYLRRQDEALQSTWVEIVRNVGQKPPILSFHNWIQKFFVGDNKRKYLRIINKFKQVFPKENIILRILEPSQINKSLFNDFLTTCSINLDEIIEVSNKNVSPGVKTIEAIRLIKNNINFEKIHPDDWTYLVKRIEEFGNNKNWNKNKLNYLDENLSEKIMSVFKFENQKIASEYFSRNRLFSQKNFNDILVDNFSYDDFSKEEIIELFSFIIDLGFKPQL